MSKLYYRIKHKTNSWRSDSFDSKETIKYLNLFEVISQFNNVTDFNDYFDDNKLVLTVV